MRQIVINKSAVAHENELADIGLRPGLAATSFWLISTRDATGRYRRWFSPGNYLTGEPEELNFAGGGMPFDPAKLPGSYVRGATVSSPQPWSGGLTR
jgi:hypothetical protein